jgi:hypothetical protein
VKLVLGTLRYVTRPLLISRCKEDTCSPSL